MIVYYQHSTAVSDGVKKALAEVVKRKQELQLLRHAAARARANDLTSFRRSKRRIRENMSRLDRNNDLYARYVKKFSEQEDQVEKAHAQIEQLNKQINERQKALDDYLLRPGLEANAVCRSRLATDNQQRKRAAAKPPLPRGGEGG